MIVVVVVDKDKNEKKFEIDGEQVTIGRLTSNDIVLPKSNVSKNHATIIQTEAGLTISDTGSTNGTLVNGKKINEFYLLEPGDIVSISDFTLQIATREVAPPVKPTAYAMPSSGKNRIKTQELSPKAMETLQRPNPATEETAFKARLSKPESLQPQSSWAISWEHVGQQTQTGFHPNQPAVAPRATTTNVASQPPMAANSDLSAERRHESKATWMVPNQGEDLRNPEELLAALHIAFFLQLQQANPASNSFETFGNQSERYQQHRLETLGQNVTALLAYWQRCGLQLANLDRDSLVEKIAQEALQLGPIAALLKDKDVSEILVNGFDTIFAERKGKLERSRYKFSSNAALLHTIARLGEPLGRQIGNDQCMMDTRLADGSRVNAIVPPLAVKGPHVSIRKFSRSIVEVEDLIRLGSLNHEMAEFLAICVQARQSILISGGTGSGKTTLLNILGNFIDEKERIVTIEDDAELHLKQEHVVTLECRNAIEHSKVTAVTMHDLLRNALRMRPDRIIIGECRGGEALEMLQAMNTGHDGSLTTVHANSSRDALARLETLVLMAGIDLPSRSIREQIVSAIHLVVQQSRFSDGSRRIAAISEITGLEGNTIAMQDLFVFEQQGFKSDGQIQGEYLPTGIVPKFYQKLQKSGFDVNLDIFNQR